MKKFQLNTFFKIKGIGSASGLLFNNNQLYIISDNSTFLYEYDIETDKLKKIALVGNPQENIPKKDKPDFEAITNKDGILHLIGSGSTPFRNCSYTYNPVNMVVEKTNLENYFNEIKSQTGINDEEFNIEGMLFHENKQFVFQRGNGLNSKNGIIAVEGSIENPKAHFILFNLPQIKNVTTTFTDAVLADSKIFFLAAAEDTASTYNDGQILGSIIGTIDLKEMKLTDYLQISNKHKFEGLAFYKKTPSQIEFLLCEDADSEVLETSIYHLAINN